MNRLPIFVVAATVIGFASPMAAARDPEPSGWVTTGAATKLDGSSRELTVIHEMKTVPVDRTARGIARADVDKQFTVTFYRESTCSSFQAFLRAGLRRQNMRDATKEGAFVSACTTSKIAARTRVILSYRAATKTTLLSIGGHVASKVVGVDFMEAAWGVFLADPQRGFSASLVAKVK